MRYGKECKRNPQNSQPQSEETAAKAGNHPGGAVGKGGSVRADCEFHRGYEALAERQNALENLRRAGCRRLPAVHARIIENRPGHGESATDSGA